MGIYKMKLLIIVLFSTTAVAQIPPIQSLNLKLPGSVHNLEKNIPTKLENDPSEALWENEISSLDSHSLNDLYKPCSLQGIRYVWDQDLQVCQQVLDGTPVWLGFSHEWKSHPHRLSQLGSFIKRSDYSYADDHIKAERNSIFNIGAVKDRGSVLIRGQFHRTRNLQFHQTVRRCRVEGIVGQRASRTCSYRMRLSRAQIDTDQISVILNGFELEAQSYSRGYNTRGLGIRVIPGEVEGDFFNFQTHVWVHAEHSPDRPLVDDGCKKSNHCKEYSYGVKVHFLVVGVNDDSGRIVNSPEGGNAKYYQRVKMRPAYFPPMASRYLRDNSIQQSGSYEHAFVAMQGFEFALEDWGLHKKEGRYIRKLEFNLVDEGYDADEGELYYSANMYFTNAGPWPYGYHVNYRMWTAGVFFDDEDYHASPDEWHGNEEYVSSPVVQKKEPISYSF